MDKFSLQTNMNFIIFGGTWQNKAAVPLWCGDTTKTKEHMGGDSYSSLAISFECKRLFFHRR